MEPDPSHTGVAAIIRNKQNRILDLWRTEVREFFGNEIKQSLLDDRLPGLLSVVVEALGGVEPSMQVAENETTRATAHGTARAEQGYDISQITREFHAVHKVISKVCDEEGCPLTPTARTIVRDVIDSAAALGVAQCSRRREEMIREENAKRMSYAVHDFRTPLGAAALAVVQIADAIPMESRTAEVMEGISILEENIERLSVEMERTMREFATVFSETSEMRVGEIRLSDVVDQVIEQFALKARTRNLTLSSEVNSDIEVVAAPDALRRILTNLVGNALRYTPSGKVTVSSTPKERFVEITVRDTGIGIVSEKLAHIFEPGTKSSGSPGMGFGLAIAKYLVELQGGGIDVKSTLGRGTEMAITLPKVSIVSPNA